MPRGIVTQLAKKMQAAGFSALLNIFLSIVIFMNAEAGRLLGIQELPLAISPVWPPTGFALAAVLLFGFKTWPGILLGNLAYNSYHLIYGQDTFLIPVLSTCVITFGSVSQVLLGGYIMRKYSSAGYFNSVRDIFIFLLPAGLISCLIAPSIGVATLYLRGLLEQQNIVFTWV